MTRPVRGEAAAAGMEAREQDSPLSPQSPAMLVRMGGRWQCRHELTEPSTSDSPAPDVQLRS
jgi:hypothetical protein